MTREAKAMQDQGFTRRALWSVLRSLRPWLILILVCIGFSINSKFRNTFWHPGYLPNLLQQSARNIVLAVGISFVIMTGGIDLSVGSVMALSGAGIALTMSGNLPCWLALLAAVPGAAFVAWWVGSRIKSERRLVRNSFFLLILLGSDALLGIALTKGAAAGIRMEGALGIGLAIGAGCGLINGSVVSNGRVPPFVMTLGMLSVARGLTLLATGGTDIAATYPRFMALGQGNALLLISFSVVALGSLLLAHAKVGRYFLAIGGNEQATRLSGVDVGKYKTLAYLLSGVTAAVGAILITAKFGQATTNAGTGAELDAIAAAVIGGTSLSGGRGTIVGALVGALTITVIEAGLVLVESPDVLQPVILGTLIVLIVFIDQVRRTG